MIKKILTVCMIIQVSLVSFVSADGDEELNLSYRTSLKGYYAAAGTGMVYSGSGSITITGIPLTATIRDAFLYFTVKTVGPPGSTISDGIFDGNPISGHTIGTDDDPCWSPPDTSTTYRADVTPFVYGDGTYILEDFYYTVSGDGIDGASLVVIYEDPGSINCYDITIYDGNKLLSPDIWGGTPSYDKILTGFSASMTFTHGEMTVLAGNSQATGSDSTSLNWINVDINHYYGSDGEFWDTDTWDVSSMISSGDIGAFFYSEIRIDCVNLAAIILAVNSDSCLIPTPSITPTVFPSSTASFTTTPMPSATKSFTFSPTYSPSSIPTFTRTPDFTPTPTSSSTKTSTNSPTWTSTFTPSKTPTPDCYTPPDFAEGFEHDLSPWSFSVTGSVYYTRITDYSCEGSYSLQVGPSNCPAGCYWDQSVIVHHTFSEVYPNGHISFCMNSWNHFGGKIHVYINGTEFMGEWTSCDSPSYIDFYYYDKIHEIDFIFFDIPESNALFIDDFRLTSDCHGLNPPTPTPECRIFDFILESQDFESGLTGWDSRNNGAVPSKITNSISYSGSKSFLVGPSVCSHNCYGSYSVTLVKEFPETMYGINLSFWLKNSFHVGGYTQVFAWYPNTGATLLGTYLPDTTWKNFNVNYSGKLDELRFFFVDITSLNEIALDKIELRSSLCAEFSNPVPEGDNLYRILLLIVIGAGILRSVYSFNQIYYRVYFR